ncbi:hypothetical protein P3S68_021507 [Capsicum galapagoense]
MAEKLFDTSAHKLFNKLSILLDNNDVLSHIRSLCGKDFIFKLKLNSYNLKRGLENFIVSKLWIPDENLELEYKLREEEKGTTILSIEICNKQIRILCKSSFSLLLLHVKNLIEVKSEPKNYIPKELYTEKVSLDVLLDKLEDREEELHVIVGANSRKRRNLIIDEDDLIVEETNKCKK